METLAHESDQISDLPVFVVHRILSFLDTPQDLVRTSVLSKKWLHLTASFPYLCFYTRPFTSRECFLKYVVYTTSRFCLQNLPAHEFILMATILEPKELDILDRCLRLVLEKGVRKLEINIAIFSAVHQRYRLPDILLSVSVLESLTINGCDLPSSFMVDAVKFRSLIYLELRQVHIDDEVIQYLISSLPLLQVCRIIRCHGFKSFCVYGHQNLQQVWIHYITPLEILDVDAPYLSRLPLIDGNNRGAPLMNLASCKNLTTVAYVGHPLPNSNGFTGFLSNFPFIKDLVLITKYKDDHLKLSSPSLRTLVFDSPIDLEEIEFNTPNLVSFRYPCNSNAFSNIVCHNRRPLLRNSTQLKGCMLFYPRSSIETLWFQKLRQFLDKKNGFKVLNLYVCAMYTETFTELEKLKEIELPPYELEHVELHLETHEEPLAHIAFVDAVLWCCRPRSLTLVSFVSLIDFEEKSDVVKFTYEKLLQQEDQSHTNIHIVSSSSSMLMSSSGDKKAIRFIKEEVGQG